MPRSSALRAFASRRVWLLVALGFSSGLPINLVWSTLAARLTNDGLNVKTIGLFTAALAPYNLKFLWSPLLDRYSLGILGRRRGWMALTQCAVGVSLFAMSGLSPSHSTFALGCLTLVTAFFGASQDIVLDAYRTDILPAEERASGTATFVLGYRIAMLISGAGGLILSDLIGWTAVYRLMAALMLVGLVSTLVASEPEGIQAPRTLLGAVIEPFREFLSRKAAPQALAFLLVSRAGEYIGGALLTTFLISLGFSNTQIGTVNKIWGLIATMTGAFLVGLVLPKIGMRRSLIVFGLLQAVTNAAYMILAHVGKNLPVMVVAIAIHNLSIGLADGALVTYQMSLCSKRFSATQYALLSSLGAVPRSVLGSISGFIVAAWGWQGYFATAMLAGLPSLVLIATIPASLGAPPVETEVIEEEVARDHP